VNGEATMITARTPSDRGDRVFSAFFSERTADGKNERLAAAALWRQLSHNSEPPPPLGSDSDGTRGWTGTVGSGRHQVRYDARRRIVDVLGRQFDLPANDDTLLLLLEDRADEDVPAVIVISMPVPLVAGRNRDRTMTKDERLKAAVDANRQSMAVWTKAIHARAEVVAFLARGKAPR
jgi:hypothetical protein